MNEEAIWELATQGGMAALTVERLQEKTGYSCLYLNSLYPEPAFMVLSLIEGIHRQALQTKTDPSLPARDRLTGIVMAHLDASLAYRTTVARLWDDLLLMPLTLLTLRPYLVKVVKRILEEAGLEVNNAWAILRIPAYTALFLYVLHTWINDASIQQEQTLVTLDRGLAHLAGLTG